MYNECIKNSLKHNEIVREFECGFRKNRLTFDHRFNIWQIFEKNWG
jgi:hypothetical protein